MGRDDGRVHVINHPLAQMILTNIRDKSADQITFRKGLVKLGRLLGYEIALHLPVVECEVTTPLNKIAKGIRIPDIERVVIITVLRAAMPLTEGLLKIFPNARQGVISARRIEDEKSRESRGRVFNVDVYYSKIPPLGNDVTIISDPMLASGSTMLKVFEEVEKHGRPHRLMIASVISTPYAINRLMDANERVEFFTVAIDPELNEEGFIVPGLGDAGDRAFG